MGYMLRSFLLVFALLLGTSFAWADLISEDTRFGYENFYENNANIEHTLTIAGATHLLVSVVGETEDNYDFLKITDQSNTIKNYTGAFNESYLVTGDSIAVHFTSDESVTAESFLVTIQSVDITSTVTGTWKDTGNLFYLKINTDNHVFAFQLSGNTCRGKFWGTLENNKLIFQDQTSLLERSIFFKIGDQLKEDYFFQERGSAQNEVFQRLFTYDTQTDLPSACVGQDTIPQDTITTTKPGWYLLHAGNIPDISALMADQPGIDSIWGWNASEQKWEVAFQTPPPNNPFGSLTQINVNQGYWFRIQSSAIIRGFVSTVPTHVDKMNLATTTPWHLTGISKEIDVLDFFLGGLPEDGTVWSWKDQNWNVYTLGDKDETNQFNLSYGTNFGNLRTIEKNLGFWVNLQPTNSSPPEVVTVSPADASSNIATNTPIVVTFNQAMAVATLTTSNFVVATSNTPVSGTITYQQRQATFMPQNLEANTAYTVTLNTGIQNSSGIPLASDYSWSFTTTTPVDQVAPTVVSTNPVSGASGVSIEAPITVSFSEAMNAETFNQDSFVLNDASGGIAGNVHYANQVATFTPSTSLTPQATYTAILMGSIQDVAGNALESGGSPPDPPGVYKWSFTIGAAPDQTPPTVVSNTPATDATGIATMTSISVQFSEPINESTITSTTFSVSDGTSSVSGSLSYNNQTATFTPNDSLSASKIYTVTLTTGIEDSAGNALSQNYQWSFTTADDDPLFIYQWHLNNTGQSAFSRSSGTPGEDINLSETITAGYTGKNIVAMVIDTGLEVDHEDLVDNVDRSKTLDVLDKSFTDNDPNNTDDDPTNIISTQGDHGTSVAGLIAAKGWNGKGGRGVAPNTTLGAVNYLMFQNFNAFLEAHGGTDLSNGSDIFNMSYGLSLTDDATVPSTFEAHFRSLTQGSSSLRNGKGALFVKSAGNGFVSYHNPTGRDQCSRAKAANLSCENSNMDYFNSTPWFIVVGATNAVGAKSSYSTVGANIWVSAPGGEYGFYKPAMITPDQSGCVKGYAPNYAYNDFQDNSNGLNDNCNYTSTFNGTSSAAPVISGAIALILEANPALTWREVKDILASTSHQIDSDHSGVTITVGDGTYQAEQGWVTNNAGYHFHNWYGFGRIDVDKAVNMAKSYSSGKLGSFQEIDWVESGTISLDIPDDSKEGVSHTISVTNSLTIEAIQITLSVIHPYTGDLGIELTSPSGTRSILFHTYNGFDNSEDLASMVLLSNAFYGESSSGDWTLKIIDASGTETGKLDNWKIKVFGH